MDNKPLDLLTGLGADVLPHVRGHLLPHLEGTHDLLKQWGSRDALCLAGLFHAAYGTAGYHERLVSLDDRGRIAALIGDEAEQIVYMFCACDRDYVYPELIRHGRPVYRDRVSGVSSTPGTAAFADLCELTMANELQIALQTPRSSKTAAAAFGALFAQMKPYVSAAAWAEWSQVLDRAEASSLMGRLARIFRKA